MNAKEARQIADSASNKSESAQMDRIKAKIKELANDGKYKYHCHEPLLSSVKKELKNEGYEFFYIEQKDGESCLISW